MDQILEKLKNKKHLTYEESKSAFEILMTGKASDEQIFSFLTLLSEKGEVADENIWLASAGGGVGGYWGDVRSNGTGTSNGSKSTGSIPFMHENKY